MSETVKLERAGAITKLVLNRPAAYNALDAEMVEALASNLTALTRDDTVRGVVITGAGKAFCSGGDLRWVTAHPQGPAGAFHAARRALSPGGAGDPAHGEAGGRGGERRRGRRRLLARTWRATSG